MTGFFKVSLDGDLRVLKKGDSSFFLKVSRGGGMECFDTAGPELGFPVFLGLTDGR